MPDVALKDLIKYDSNGENIFDWYTQWQDRQKITNLADLKDFDKLYPNAYKGNISKREYELVTGYFNSEDKEAYIKDNPEMNTVLQDQYLKDNPDDNALLFIWGETELMSYEAYQKAQTLMDELDIPDSALSFDLPSDEAYKKYFEYTGKMAEYGKESSLHFSLSSVTEDNLNLFYLDMQYALLRNKDGTTDTKARENFRRAHKDYNQYGIDQGWWKQLS
jgi:hypothetical protein